MEETEIVEEQAETRNRADELIRLKVAFGDDVAQRFLRLRGIVGDRMQEAVLERYAAKQAARLARDVIAAAGHVDLPMPAPALTPPCAPAPAAEPAPAPPAARPF